MSTSRSWWRAGIVAASLALLSGCATTPAVELPEGTLMLGEVRHVFTRALLQAGEIAPGEKRENLLRMMTERGWTDAQLDQGRLLVVRTRIYWNNTSSGNRYAVLNVERLADGVTAEPFNIVEFTVGGRSGAIQRVRAKAIAEGRCDYVDVPVGMLVEAMGTLALVGPRGTASLYCSGIEQEGWQRPRTYWHKLPGPAGAR
jgi:hypothetical protein